MLLFLYFYSMQFRSSCISLICANDKRKIYHKFLHVVKWQLICRAGSVFADEMFSYQKMLIHQN